MSREIDALKKLLARLPGLGEKSGARLAYYIWSANGKYSEDLAKAILEVRERVKPCPVCGNPSTESPCPICADEDRDHSTVMVVEGPQDLAAIEAIGSFKGVYHVLGGTLSPLAGRTPDDLNIQGLMERAGRPETTEVVLATNPSSEGDATAGYLEEELAALGRADLKVTRLARGMTMGSEIKYLDPMSLEEALKGRRGKTD